MIKAFLLIPVFVFGSLFTFAQEGDIHYQILENYIRTDARTEVDIPDIFGYKSLLCDFHTHTIFSDGQVTPKERIDEAWREGLDAIAITDHTTTQPEYINADYNTSYNLAKERAEERGILLIKATEYTQIEPTGHFNLLFIDDANQYANPALSPEQALGMAAEKGAFVIYNHPGWPDQNSDLTDYHMNMIAQKKIHGMEVVNYKEFYPLVMDYCNKYNITPLSTTDIHVPIQTMFDLHDHKRNFTIVLAKDKSLDAIKEALFAGRTIACADDLLIGKPEYLLEMIRISLVPTNYKVDGSQFQCNVSNKSDINYTLKGENHQYIIFPANKTVQLQGAIQKSNTIYRVSNTYTSSTGQIEIPLSYLITEDDQIPMPFVKQQDNKMLKPESKIEMFCFTKDAEIRYTLDGTEPNENSSLYQKPVLLDHSGTISLKAYKKGMKPSWVFRTVIVLDKYHDAEKVKLVKNGLNYTYFEGEFKSVFDFENNGNLKNTGTTDIPNLSIAAVEDHFGIKFNGYIYAPVSGLYTFKLKSDDGSTFRISGVDLIDNDGSHSVQSVEGEIKLKKGYHPIELRYLEDWEDQDLEFSWELPGKEMELVGAKYLFIKNK